MALKALMVDVDGVIVRHPSPGWRWDVDMAADLGVKPDDLQLHFFGPHFRDVVLGRAELAARLAPVLAVIAPKVSAETLIAYWFAKDANLDHALLEELAELRATGLELHLATVQEHRRADYLWTNLGLSQRFDGLHHSAAVGAAKPDAAYFQEVQARTGFAADELVLIDDSARNVEAARAAGWGGIYWSGEERLTPLLEPWLTA